MTRPKKTYKQRRSRVVSFRLTPDEYERLAAEGQSVGLWPNDCARIKAIGGPAPLRGEPLLASGQEPIHLDLWRELRRVGVNMNQIARTLNWTGEYEPSEVRAAFAQVAAVYEIVLKDITD